MKQINAKQRDLLVEAANLERAISAAEQRYDQLRSIRTEKMKEMHQAGIPWAEIARIFKQTPQAAMYATGHAVRQSRSKKAAAAKDGKAAPPAKK